MSGLSVHSSAFQVLKVSLFGLPLLVLSDSLPLFTELPSSSSGITWIHEKAVSDQRHLPETVLGGVAILDFDQDGWMDVYFVNSGESDFFKPPRPLRNALYRNNRDGTFTDVTSRAGVEGGTFGMGAAAGDYDNDGYPDIFVTSYGRTILYHNRGDGTFAENTEEAGVLLPGWTTSAAWFDYDGDGFLDLFVCQYVEYGPEERIACGLNPLGKAYYCVPRVFNPTSSMLFRNSRNGKFTRASQGTALEKPGKALGVVATDINNDRRMDLYVANDTVENFLFMNRGKDEWEEIALLAGIALSVDGKVQSGMGVDAGDFDGDGWQDLVITNFDHEYHSLFQNNHNETFQDLAPSSELGRSSYLLSGWGVKLFDFDNDGDIDLFIANGHPDDQVDEYMKRFKDLGYPDLVTYKEPLLLFENDRGRIKDISRRAGPAFSQSFPSRGLAVGDLDNDGRTDVVISNIGESPLVLRNESAKGHHWIGLELEGRISNRDAIGAKISWSIDGVQRSRLITGGGSYLSSHDLRQIIGLGRAGKVEWLEIQWPQPSGKVERFTELAVDRYVQIKEGG